MAAKHVGEYELRYTPRELEGVPPSIFIESKTDFPVINRPGFLSAKDCLGLYQDALKNYANRQFATVHDYSTSQGSRIDTEGRYTHYIPVSQQSYNFLDQTLEQQIYPLIKEHYDIGEQSLYKVESWQILGYGEGYFFNVHCDNCILSTSSPTANHDYIWWNNTPDRKFTVLLYINDQADAYAKMGTYSGGDLIMNRIFKDDEVYRIKPTAGTLVAFPSNFLYNHEVRKVTRGYRLAAVTWLGTKM